MKSLFKTWGWELLLLVILVVASSLPQMAQAQIILAVTPYDCIPKDYMGEGTKLHRESIAEGEWYEWACPISQADGGVLWKSQTFVVLAGKRMTSYPLVELLREVTSAPDPVAALNAFHGRMAIAPATNEERAIFEAMHFYARQWGVANDPKPVPGGVWNVAVNGTAATRQWYLISADDVLGLKYSGATVGARCWPKVRWTTTLANGAVTYYMAFGTTEAAAATNSNRVTVCTRTS